MMDAGIVFWLAVGGVAALTLGGSVALSMVRSELAEEERAARDRARRHDA